MKKKTRNINAQVLQPPVLWTGCCNCCIVVETEATVPKYHICYETVTYIHDMYKFNIKFWVEIVQLLLVVAGRVIALLLIIRLM